MKKPTTTLLTLMLVVAAGQCAFAADLLAVYREASLQDAVYGSAKAQYIAAQERLPQARYDLVVAQELVAQNDVEVKNRALEQIVGKPVGEISGLTTPITLNAPQPAEMNAWVEQAYQSSLQIALAQQSVELATREVERASAGHRPTLDAVGKLAEADLADINALLKDGAR